MDFGPSALQFARHLFREAQDGVWLLTDGPPETLWISPTFWTCLGFDPDEAQRDLRAWTDPKHPAGIGAAIGELKRFHAAATGRGTGEDGAEGAVQTPYDTVVRYRHADGSPVWMHCKGSMVRDAAGTPIGICALHQDLTAMIRAERRLEQEVARGERAEGDLRTFAYSVSHALRAPASTSLSLADLALEELRATPNAPPDVIDLLGHAQVTLGRMLSLIDDAHDFGKLMEAPAEFVRTELNALAEAAIADLEADIRRTQACIRVEHLGAAQCVPLFLRSLITQLLSNAMKYAKPDAPPAITLSSDVDAERCVRLSVRDDGIGIAPEFHERIFELYSRLHRDDVIPGSGLGLALCARVAAIHGGSISVSSAEGEGATFTVRLPAAAA